MLVIEHRNDWEIRFGKYKGKTFYECLIDGTDEMLRYWAWYYNNNGKDQAVIRFIEDFILCIFQNTKLGFGKYKELLLKEVWQKDKSYCEWLSHNCQQKHIRFYFQEQIKYPSL